MRAAQGTPRATRRRGWSQVRHCGTGLVQALCKAQGASRASWRRGWSQVKHCSTSPVQALCKPCAVGAGRAKGNLAARLEQAEAHLMALLRGREGSIGEVVSAKLALAQAEYERLRMQARATLLAMMLFCPCMPSCKE